MEQRKRVYYDLKQKLLYNLFDVWCINKIRIFFIFEEKDICCKLLSLYEKVLLVFLLYLIIESNVIVCDSLIIVFLIISVGKN